MNKKFFFTLLLVLALALSVVPVLADEPESYALGDEFTAAAADAVLPTAIPADTHWEYQGAEPDKTLDPICGLTEHEHGAGCVTAEPSNELTAEQYAEADADFAFPLPYDLYYELDCETKVHEHDDGCYELQATDTLCPKSHHPEDAVEGDVNEHRSVTCIFDGSDWYVAEQALICTTPLHTHDEDPDSENFCYKACESKDDADLTVESAKYYLCASQAHEHADACYPQIYTWELVRDTGALALTIKYPQSFKGSTTYYNIPNSVNYLYVKLTDADGNVQRAFSSSSGVVNFANVGVGEAEIEVQLAVQSRNNNSLYFTAAPVAKAVVVGDNSETINLTKASSADYFNHIDIQAGVGFTVMVDGVEQQASIDLHATNATMADVGIYYILDGDENKTKHYVYVTGDWSSEGQGDGYEYQIPGVFPKAAQYCISCPLAVDINGMKDTVNYSGFFRLNCADEHCPGSGTTEGMDPELSAESLGNFFSKGTLNIYKEVEGDTPSTDGVFQFSIYGPLESEPAYRYVSGETNYAVTGESYVTITDLPVGTYVITEVSLPAHYTVAGAEKQAVLKPSNAVTDVTFTNYYDADDSQGTLRVVKQQSGLDADVSFTVSGPDSYAKEFTIKATDFVDGEAVYSIPGLAAGDYTVTEDDPEQDGYELAVTDGTNDLTADGNGDYAQAIAVVGGKAASVTFVNAYEKLVDFTFTKIWDGAAGRSINVVLQDNDTPANEYSLTIDQTKGVSGGYSYTASGLTTPSWEVCVSGLPAGKTYTIKSESAAGYDTTIIPAGDGVTLSETRRVTSCNSLTIANISSPFFAIKSGNQFILWTKEAIDAADLLTAVEAYADAGDPGPFKNMTIGDGGNTTVVYGTESSPIALKQGNVSVSIDKGVVKLTFADKSNWAQLLCGRYDAATATPTVINSQAEISVEAKGSLTVEKGVTGTTATDKTFTFKATLGGGTEDKGAATAYDGAGVYTLSMSAGGSATITGIPVGTAYAVTEPSATIPAGYSLASSANVSGSIDLDGETATFTNSYASSVPEENHVSLSFTATKTLQHKALIGNDFTFALSRLTDGDPVQLQSKTNAANGAITFDAIEYSAAGTYRYAVSELIPAEADRDAHIAYSAAVHEVTVVVSESDDGAGVKALSVDSVTVDGGNNVYVNGTTTYSMGSFTNTYTPDAVNAQLQLEKQLDGRALAADDFTFALVEVDAGGVAVAGGTTAEAANAVNGAIVFDLAYTTVGTHYYQISESVPAVEDREKGMTYSDETMTVRVDVSRNNDGTLATAITYPQDVTFNNSYEADAATYTLSGHKTLTGRDNGLRDNEFSFRLSGDDIAAETVSNNAAGDFSFSALTFTAAGEYTYTVREVAGTNSRITYDRSIFTVSITVADVGGELEVTSVAYTDSLAGSADEITFANRYSSGGGRDDDDDDDDDEGGGSTVIEDENPPLDDTPITDEPSNDPQDNATEIIDEEVPLADSPFDAPKTGDSSLMLIMLIVMFLCLVGACAMLRRD